MTPQAFRTLVVPSSHAPLARQICATLAPSGGSAMLQTGLSADGEAPATHYVSTGWMDADFAALMPLTVWEQDAEGVWQQVDYYHGDSEAVVALCGDDGLTVDEAEVADLFAVSDVTEQEPFVAFGRLGLQLVQEPMDV